MAFDPDHNFDLGFHRSLRYRAFRRRVVLLVGLFLFLEFMGLPHVRFTGQSRHGRRGQTVYVSVTGSVSERVAGAGPHRPLIILLPMSPPPSHYATVAFEHGRAFVQDSLSKI